MSKSVSAKRVGWLGRHSATCAGCHSRTASRRGIWQTTPRCVSAAVQSCLASHPACSPASKSFACKGPGAHSHSKLRMYTRRNAEAVLASLQSYAEALMGDVSALVLLGTMAHGSRAAAMRHSRISAYVLAVKQPGASFVGRHCRGWALHPSWRSRRQVMSPSADQTHRRTASDRTPVRPHPLHDLSLCVQRPPLSY